MVEGGFFSPSRSSFTTGNSKSGDGTQVAGFFSKKKEVPTKKFKGIKGRTAEIDAINSQTYRDMGDESMADTFKEKYNIDPRDYMNLQSKRFVSPSGDEVGQIASATSDLSGLLANKQPLSPIGSDAYNKEVEGFIKSFKDDFLYRDKFDVDTGERKDRYGRPIPGERFGEEEMKRDYPFRRQFRYENWDGEKYTPGVPFGQKPKTEEKGNIFQRVGNFLANTLTGSQPVAAGTLDAQPKQVGYQPVGPKLNYVNPDAKTMTMSQIGEAFKPKNLFGYQDKFGRYDDPGSPLDRQRQETMKNVYNRFTRPITPDARTIGQIRQDQKESMQESARLRYQDFKDRKALGPAANIQKTFGADDTYGTNVPSNPAMGFSGKMDAEAQSKYAQAAREATAGAQPDSSLGNVMTQTYNRIASRFGLPQKSLETVDQRQLKKAQEAYNKPRYQQEAYARKMLGITNDMVKADNMQRIRANAYARNQAFQNERRQKALEKSALRRGENIGTGRDGGFGLGTSGQGMPSNPKGFSGYSRKSSPSTGTGTGTSPSRSRPGSKKASRGSSPGSRSRGGTGTGSKSNTGSKKASRGTAGSSSRGGTGTGGTKTSRTASKASKSRTGRSKTRCDIRCKIDITSLTNQNLIKDDLATVAYFVQELRNN